MKTSPVEVIMLNILSRDKPLPGVKPPRKANKRLPKLTLLKQQHRGVPFGDSLCSSEPLPLDELEFRLKQYGRYYKHNWRPSKDLEVLAELFEIPTFVAGTWLADARSIIDTPGLRSGRSSNLVRALTLRNWRDIRQVLEGPSSWLVEQGAVVYGVEDDVLKFDGRPIAPMVGTCSGQLLSDAVTLVKYRRDAVWQWVSKAYPALELELPSAVELLAAVEAQGVKARPYMSGKPPSELIGKMMKEYYYERDRGSELTALEGDTRGD